MLAKPRTKWLKMSLSLLFVLTLLTATRCDISRYVPYDYCDPNLKLCPVPELHTMCRYPVPGLSEDCLPNVNKPLTPAEKVHVLNLHNELRSRVASGEEKTPLGELPSASDMLQMRWDVELETIAERWASRCFNVTVTKIHDDCRNTKRFRVAQNIGTIGSEGITAEKKVIQVFYHWYMKSKTFNPRIINAYVADDNKASEEFVNLIWADTYALGCATVIFRKNVTDSEDGDKATPWTFERIVCNYGPAGVIPGKPIYTTGMPCSRCPAGWSCSKEYKGLCTLNDNSESSSRKTTRTSFAVNVKERTSIAGAGSTTWYANSTHEMAEPHPATATSQKWRSLPVDNDTHKYSVKLRVGIYYNGVCHCPDITRYGFERSVKHSPNMTVKLEKLKSLITRSIGYVVPQHGTGNFVFGLKNGDRCYCKTNISHAGDQRRPSTLLPFLIWFHIMKLLIYFLE